MHSSASLSTSPDDLQLREHGQFLRTLARALMADEADADDVVQETLIARWLSSEKRSSRPWLATILRRKASNAHRSERVRRDHESLAQRSLASADSTRSVERIDVAEKLLAHVRDLDVPVREAVIARYYDGLTYSQIAGRDGVPASTIKSRVQRGLEELRVQLDREEPDGRAAWMSALGGIVQSDHKDVAGPLEAAGTSTELVSHGGAIAWTALFGCAAIGAAVFFSRGQNTSGDGDASAVAIDQLTSQDRSTAMGGEMARIGASPSRRPAAPNRVDALADESDMTDGTVLTQAAGGSSIPLVGTLVTWDDPRAQGSSPSIGGLGYGSPPEGAVAKPSIPVMAPDEQVAKGGTATTKSDGRFIFDHEPSGEQIRLRIEADDTYRETVWRGTNEEWLAARPIELVRVEHGNFEGRVVDLEGRPLAGAKVIVKSAFDGEVARTTSSEDGSFAFVNLRQGYAPKVELNGYVVAGSAHLEQRDSGGWTPQTLVLAREGTLRVVLRLPDDAPEGLGGGTAIAFVSVSEVHQNRPGGHVQSIVEKAADGSGIAELQGLPVGQRLHLLGAGGSVFTHRVGKDLLLAPASDDDALPLGAEPVVIPASGLLEVEMPEPFIVRLRGQVVDAGGVPVSMARLEGFAEWLKDSASRARLGIHKTDAEGRFDLAYSFARTPQPFAVHVLQMGGSRSSTVRGYARKVIVPGSAGLDELVIRLQDTPRDVIRERVAADDPFSDELEKYRRAKSLPAPPQEFEIVGAVDLEPIDDDLDIYVAAFDRTGEPLAFGLSALGHPSRFIAVDKRGSFQFKAPAGNYTMEIGTREELRTGSPRRGVTVKIDATGMTPSRL